MKLFLKIFNKRGRIFPSIVQVILTVMILPALCFLLSLLTGGDRAFSMITNLLGELSITEYWVDLLLLLSEDPGSISSMNIYRFSIQYIDAAVFETCVIGMCVSLCKNIGVIVGIRGIPLLQSILGIFLGCIMACSFEVSNDMSTLFYCAMLIILNVVVIWLIPTHAFYRKFLATLLGLGLQIIVAVFSSGYVVYLTLIREGRIRDLNIAIPCLLAIFVPLGAVVAFDYFFLTPEKDSLGL